MPTEIRMLGWAADGLRCPDHEISFLDGQKIFPVSLIQMPNGTGKTTILELLRATLSGDAANGKWDSNRVKSMAKKGGKQEEGSFTVKLLANNRRLTIELKLNFEDGTASYTTTGQVGISQGFQPPRDVGRFLRPEFVKFFVFDGELAERLLNHTDTNAQMAIEELFQLRLLTGLSLRIKAYWEEIANSKTAKDIKGLSRRANKVQFLKARIQKLTEMQENTQRQLDAAKVQLHGKETKFQAELDQQEVLKKQVEEANSALEASNREMDGTAKDILLKMRNPHALSSVWAKGLLDLKYSLDRVKLPESAAREFFEELAKEPDCVCARPLDEASRTAIRQRAQRYFGSEDVALLNSIKADITSLIGEKPDDPGKELDALFVRLDQVISEYENSRTYRDGLIEEATNVNPKLKEVESEINGLKGRIHELQEEADKFKDTSEALGDEQTFGIDVLKRRLKTAEKQLADITDTLELKLKTATLSQLVEKAHALARDSVNKKICAEANKRIEELMPYNSIRIERVDRCLRLLGQEGGSVGEQLAIAYAFLSTMFNCSDHSLPFIVDSPANPIDLHVRRRVADLIPNLTDQFIAFTISSERQGFLDPLETSSKQAIHHVTMFRKGNSELEVKARQVASCKETLDGVLVCDRDFFCDFQLDDENGSTADGVSN